MNAGGGNGEDDGDGRDPRDEAQAEPRGLTGVDVEPLPPADREQLEALRRENDELREQLLRRRADFENYKRRVERDRSEEHTSELQSRLHLVCRLLLEKKKKIHANTT